ncbi:glycoside hydrolase family 2 protein [Paenibacillus lupini]|uniref:glycoside hydrolase family 2 protein n=1 Tax=Paenibacillus lupini TaxID=1450204 RepID=UPI00141D8EC8|nr:glycoside hydrolase family 2 TIM barrel-domain containing protein [Paenibacillus lupini]NIK22167.1 beta-mannosidase [Paenibacillus lupini]
MMEINLNDKEWELKGFWPWVPCKGTSMEIGNELMGVTEWLPATVPGGVHQDLYKAGLINNPYVDLNSLHCEWVENRWWVYRTQFQKPIIEPGDKVEIVFMGLDYEAIISMNGTLLGEHAGMYEPAVYDITELLGERDMVELQIVLKQAPDEMGQIGKTSETFTQKSRFNYKWDFSTRLVNVGIWDDVLLRVSKGYSLEEIALHSDVTTDGHGVIRVAAGVRNHHAGDSAETLDYADVRAELEVTGPNGDFVNSIQVVLDKDGFQFDIPVPTPQLWYPNGYGEQPLYQVTIRLLQDNKLLDQRVHHTGIRKLEYRQNEGSPVDALPYTFVVNGVPIYIQGANLTPLDHLYGNVTRERYEWMVHLAKQVNLNMLRIWGGGVIEKTYLYDLCDRHGIMIWQEFIQSSSGIDNKPSQKPSFLELLHKNAVAALKTRRNHVSLTVWSGGNELMSEPNRPSTYEDSNLSHLKSLVEQYDPQRLFLPTSASGPVQYITREKGVSHDVHGHWKYEGNPNHYSLYGEADHLFHSEFGVDGVSGVKSLRKFLSLQHLTPVSMRDNLVWRHHGEWWDTYDRDAELFGHFESLSQFSDASQWMQAEGLRFILEANRRRQFQNSGSIIWQLNEPWPNASCTNLVDYYMEPKMAYYWTRNAFRHCHASLDYRSLNAAAGEWMEAGIYLHQASESCEVAVEVWDTRGSLLFSQLFDTVLQNASVTKLGNVRFVVPHTYNGLFIVRLGVTQMNQVTEYNDYFFSTNDQEIYRSALQLEGAQLNVQAQDEWSYESLPGGEIGSVLVRSYMVTNEGHEAALHVRPEERTDVYWTSADDAFFTLLPGESRQVKVTCTKRNGELFVAENSASAAHQWPDIVFTSFGSIQASDKP